MKVFLLFFLSVSLLFSASVAKVLSKSGSVVVVRKGAQSLIKQGSLLNEKDIIMTDKISKLRIVFTDKTVISIGKNSKFVITSYGFEKKRQEATFSFSGAMKAVTGTIGKINPKKFKVRLRTNTIGIRGTKFYIDTSNNTTAACINGAITVSKPTGGEILVNAGQLTKIGASGIPSVPRLFSPGEIKALAGLIGLSAAEFLFDMGGDSTKSEKKQEKRKAPTLKEQIHKKKTEEKQVDRFKIHEL